VAYLRGALGGGASAAPTHMLLWDWRCAGRCCSSLFHCRRRRVRGARTEARPLRPAQDGDTLNNYVEVAGEPGAAAARARLLSEDAPLTADERARLERHFGVHG